MFIESLGGCCCVNDCKYSNLLVGEMFCADGILVETEILGRSI